MNDFLLDQTLALFPHFLPLELLCLTDFTSPHLSPGRCLSVPQWFVLLYRPWQPTSHRPLPLNSMVTPLNGRKTGTFRNPSRPEPGESNSKKRAVRDPATAVPPWVAASFTW